MLATATACQRTLLDASQSLTYSRKPLSPCNLRSLLLIALQVACGTVTAEVASSSLVVPAIPSKRLSSTFERMAWYTKRCTLSDAFCGHSLVPFSKNHFHDFRLCPPFLATDGVRVDIHGDVAVGVTHKRLHRLYVFIVFCEQCAAELSTYSFLLFIPFSFVCGYTAGVAIPESLAHDWPHLLLPITIIED